MHYQIKPEVQLFVTWLNGLRDLTYRSLGRKLSADWVVSDGSKKLRW